VRLTGFLEQFQYFDDPNRGLDGRS
jgi:hypothetical protein